MKKIAIIFSIIVFVTITTFGRVHIILFDCSGSFIGKNVPEVLRTGALQKISELTQIIDHRDTLIFIPIRENSTISSLRQIRFHKAAVKRVYDSSIDKENSARLKKFASKIIDEINQPASKMTDIISAINYAASIAHLSNDSYLWILSDGDDNVKADMFNNLNGIKVYHQFIFSSDSKKIQVLCNKWKSIYSSLGASKIVVLDAQSSLSFKLGF